MNEKYKITKTINKEVINEILTIKDEQGLTADNVLIKARDKNNPLHRFFDWDDTSASKRFRRYQAINLINQIQIVVEDKTMYAMEHVNIKISGNSYRKEYKTVKEITANKNYHQQIIERILQHQMYWAKQYEFYGELTSIVTAIRKTKEDLDKKWQKKKKQ